MKKFGALLGRSKPRLYMALYPRGGQPPGGVKYHTALLLIPKGADPESDEPNASRYHVTNPLVGGQQVWQFDPGRTCTQTQKPGALILLGKVVASASQMEKILCEVPVVNDDPAWRCRHWVWSAVDALVVAGVIALLSPPNTIWDIGVAFADANPVDPETGVIPTCTTKGELTKSALEGA
ncbi:hypothetical protein FPV67DRAFT_215839 [Lyophyllum atratum]|nr:hypothetical protein FPV67DRAFT_215839 [Lyophyllum atratum]